MRRRRWARAAALCLAIAVLLQLAAVHCAGASARTPAFSVPARGRAAQRWVPSPSMPMHHAVPKPSPRAGARAVAFDATATAAAARCKGKSKTSAARKPTAGGRDDAACDDDDKRRIPTGPNPLHNR